jgi:alanine dehydrogenase
MTPTLHLTEADLKPLMDMGEAIACLEKGFGRWGEPDVINMTRRRGFSSQGTIMMMGAVDGPSGIYGFKTYFPNKLRMSAGVYVTLHSFAEGRLLAMMQAEAMSQMRTGAASGLATKLLANEDASALGIIGTGKQAFAQTAALCHVRPIKHILAFGRDEEKRDAFVKRLKTELKIETRGVDDARNAVEPADIVVTSTNSATPVFDGAWLKPGSHVNAAGANHASRSEIDEVAMARTALISTDDREQAKIEAAEFVTRAREGLLDWASVVELGELVTGKIRGRTSAADITLFKSLGIAYEDVLYAQSLYGEAVKAGIGQRF